MPVITPLPPPPSTSDPANFSSRADAHISALQTFTDEINAFGLDLAGVGIIAQTRDSIVANATTTDLWNGSKVQDWTGTPTITSLPNAPYEGVQRVAYPTAGTIITHGGNISVQGNANYTVQSGDEITITSITISTFYISIKKRIGNSFTDVAQTFTAGQRGEVTALTDGTNIASNFNDSNFFSVTLAGNRTLDNPSNLVAGQSGSIFITQDATGSRTLAYGSYWDFANGTVPSLSTAANSVDRLDYVVRTSTSIHAVLSRAWS